MSIMGSDLQSRCQQIAGLGTGEIVTRRWSATGELQPSSWEVASGVACA